MQKAITHTPFKEEDSRHKISNTIAVASEATRANGAAARVLGSTHGPELSKHAKYQSRMNSQVDTSAVALTSVIYEKHTKMA